MAKRQRYSFTSLISGQGPLLLEHRIFNVAAFVFLILSFVLAVSSLLGDAFPWIRVSLVVLSLVFALIYYSARTYGKFLLSSKVFVLLTLLFNDIAWCWSISSTPTANYFFVLIVVLDLTILPVKHHLTFIVFAVLNIFLVDYLVATFPEQVLQDPELLGEIRFPYRGHILLSALVCLIALILAFFKRSYEKERQHAREISRQLINVNQSLQNRNEHLESMARMVSHNLRSPMAGLKMLMKLYDEVPTEEDRQELMGNFKEGARTLFNMVDDLSEIMMDYRELVKERENLPLAEVLEKVTTQLSHQIRESGAVIESDFSEIPEVVYSPYFLESIFLNLISNAIKYRDPERRPVIFIRSYRDEDRIMLSVKDNGIGINLEENGAKMFQMYKTFHNNKEIDSKGIGLFITKNQVETMGGKIKVQSEPKVGTTFFIELYRL